MTDRRDGNAAKRTRWRRRAETAEVQPAPSEEGAARIKNWFEAMSSVTTFGYRSAAAVGALVTFGYLWSIGYYPSGMTPGEALFFLLIAFAFAIFYLLVLGYGAFAILWLVNGVISARYLLSFSEKALISQLLGPAPTAERSRLHDYWRKSRLASTRARLDQAYAVPVLARGWLMGIGSFLFAGCAVLVAYVADQAPLTEFLLAAVLAGGLALGLVSIQVTPDKRKQKRIRLLILAFAPAMVLVFQVGPRALLNPVFQGIGIRVPKVSLELPASELGLVTHIGAHIDRPLVDCRRLNPSMILVHGVEVAWTGIGNQTVVRFAMLEPKRRAFFTSSTRAKYVQIKFDTQLVRILEGRPAMDSCFSLRTGTMFGSSDDASMAEARRRISTLVAAIKYLGAPQRITMRYAGPVCVPQTAAGSLKNVPIHEKRTAAVVLLLRGLIDSDAIEFVVDDAICGPSDAADDRIEFITQYRR